MDKRHGLVIAQGLGKEEMDQIRALSKLVETQGGFHLRINWDMLAHRNHDERSDFLYYQQGELVGFLGLYAYWDDEVEVNGMVHPQWRKQGIFQAMFAAAKKEAEEQGFYRMMLISERTAEAGIGFVKGVNAQYAFSEYKMELQYIKKQNLNYGVQGLLIRETTSADAADLAAMDESCFEVSKEIMEASYMGPSRGTSWLAEKDGEKVAKIRYLKEGDNAVIYGFCVPHKYRGSGYGRELLWTTVARLFEKGYKKINLEVTTENERALGLFTDCGFQKVTVYDYYQLELKKK